MENSNSKKTGPIYMEQMKLRKKKLENIRKERQLWQLEKNNRIKKTSENISEGKRFQNEIRARAEQLKDEDIDELNLQLNKAQDPKVLTTVTNYKTREEETSACCTKKSNLNFSEVQITEVPPKLIEKDVKQTQTDNSSLKIYNEVPFLKSDFDDSDDYVEPHNDMDLSLKLFCTFSSNLPPGILSPGLPNVMDVPPAQTPIDKDMPGNSSKQINNEPPKERSPCKNLTTLDDFQSSLKRVSLMMEKVLVTNKNFDVDYIVREQHQAKDDFYDLLNVSQVFYDHNLTKERCVTCIDWSEHYTGQIVAAYYKSEEFPKKTDANADADVIVWHQYINENIPQHIFHCHSPVLCVSYTNINPNLILGSTYSGQIVMWDSRIKTPLPVQCSKLTSKAHNQPVYCLYSIDDNIISISSDGNLCLWNMDMLSKPLDVTQLQYDVSCKVKKQIPISCMDFTKNHFNNLIMGGEDGYAYLAFQKGYQSGVNKSYGKHDAPVTGISSHYNQLLSPEFGDLFLTSSIDSSVKLWSLQRPMPICTFRTNYDYAMDVAWSPSHPAVFIAVGGSGHLDIFNLNENVEEPIKSLAVKDNKAINRIVWNKNGQQVSIGTDNGEIYIYNAADALANPSQEEWNNFKKSLFDIKSNYGAECCDDDDISDH